MAFPKNQLLIQEYEYDFAVDGGATGVFDLSSKANKADLPVGAIRKSAHVLVQTALVGVGASAKLGTTASDATFAANAGVGTYSLNAIFNNTTAVAVSAASGADCVMTVAGAPLTAGKLKVLVEFILPNS